MNIKDIDRIYVISLPGSERRNDVRHHMNDNFIWFHFYDGIENKEDGAAGLKETFKKLFTEALNKGYKNLMVFEDDASFTCSNVHHEIGWVINDLPADYHICKFGANLLLPVEKVTDNINRVKLSYALHACLYSRIGMELILEHIDDTDEPIDVIIAKFVEPLGHCYVSSKMIATQRPYKSNIFQYDQLKHRGLGKFYEIDKGIIRWDLMMEDRWEAATKHLKNETISGVNQ